jgi:hypothetical protein
VGVTGISNPLKYKNKVSSIDNINCIINGIFNGITRGLQSKNQQYHERQNGAVMVSRVPN